jgi:hypothetical protein
MRGLWFVVLVAGCGRIGFDATGGGGGGSGSGSALAPDATSACVADGFCPPSCGAADPDCQTVCGDSKCVGNAGELCTTCNDCKTTANVCGNATCGPGEDGTTCYSDCGPLPWTWTVEEADLFTAINQARTGGTVCAGAAMMATAPAVTRDATLDAAARDMVWEEAQFGTLGLSRCDGQSMIAYFGQINVYAAHISGSNTQTSTSARMTNWIMNSTDCPNTLMNTSFSQVGVGIATASTPTVVVVFR